MSTCKSDHFLITDRTRVHCKVQAASSTSQLWVWEGISSCRLSLQKLEENSRTHYRVFLLQPSPAGIRVSQAFQEANGSTRLLSQNGWWTPTQWHGSQKRNLCAMPAPTPNSATFWTIALFSIESNFPLLFPEWVGRWVVHARKTFTRKGHCNCSPWSPPRLTGYNESGSFTLSLFKNRAVHGLSCCEAIDRVYTYMLQGKFQVNLTVPYESTLMQTNCASYISVWLLTEDPQALQHKNLLIKITDLWDSRGMQWSWQKQNRREEWGNKNLLWNSCDETRL